MFLVSSWNYIGCSLNASGMIWICDNWCLGGILNYLISNTQSPTKNPKCKSVERGWSWDWEKGHIHITKYHQYFSKPNHTSFVHEINKKKIVDLMFQKDIFGMLTWLGHTVLYCRMQYLSGCVERNEDKTSAGWPWVLGGLRNVLLRDNK